MAVKRAVIEVELGYESTQASNEQIVKDIRKEFVSAFHGFFFKLFDNKRLHVQVSLLT